MTRGSRWPGWAIAALAVVAVTGSLAFVEPLRVTSDSMVPTLSPGGEVVMLRARWAGDPQRGDIVVVDGRSWTGRGAGVGPSGVDPGAGFASTTPAISEGAFVKRVVAVAGDRVGLEDGVLVVNGAPVDEPYVDLEQVDSVYFGPETVPEDRVFLMGDNRAGSVDSRDLGPVPLEEVEGRILTRDSWGSLLPGRP